MDKKYITDEEAQEYLAYHNSSDVLNNYIEGLKSLENYKFSNLTQHPILISGAMVAFDKKLIDYLNKWHKRNSNLFLLSEVTAENKRYTREKVLMPFICTPHLLAKEMIILGMDVPVNIHMIQTIERKAYLKEAVSNLEFMYTTIGKGYAIAWSYYAYMYINILLKKLSPKKVVLWNEFYAFHHIFEGICLESKIPVYYMEFGCLPGTLCVEKQGQQGKSCVATSYRKFRKKAIAVQDILQTEKCIAYMRATGINRNVQPHQYIQKKMLNYYVSGRKTILFCGQNDFESGMVPYTKETKKFHSPIFKTSLEAVQYIWMLTVKNNWNLIFKPHPIMCALGHSGKELQTKMDIVSEVNINSVIDFSNLVITILSQCAYIALIRERPVLMIGYSQLRGKKCTYEAFKAKNIELQIKEALCMGYTEKQKDRFKIHVAQLLKYYLYDDEIERSLRFGQPIEELERGLT